VRSRVKTSIQVTIIFVVTGVLIWVSLRGLAGEDKGAYLLQTWKGADKGWLWLMALLGMVAHLLRAERWRMLLEPSGYKGKLGYSFLSLMVGYLVNMVIPRGGELSRCYNLYKLDNTPVEISFGTVVVERIVDLLCLLALIALAFLLESEKLFAFLETLPVAGEGSMTTLTLMLYGVGALLLLVLMFVILVKKNKKLNAFFHRTWDGFKEGLLSIAKVKRKWLFIGYSIVIWILYFSMSYTVIQAFPETKFLGIKAVLSLFAIGSIAMAAPLPGGAGSYHVLVPQGLVFLYQVPMPDAVAFTFIFHGWQTAILIVGGAISLLVTSFIVRKKSARSA
jgi:uncharacterized protein (TIRG00374 family)